jgi:3-methyladenine DNA glycosylase AlkD
MHKLIDEFKKYLCEMENPERAAKEKAYLYSDQKHYGLSANQMSNYFKNSKKQILELGKEDALKLVVNLWEQGSHEERMFSLFILNEHAKSLNIEDKKLIEKLMRESRGWVYLDSFIIQIMPELLKKHPETYEWLKEWITDTDYWVRRSALLAQLLMFRKNEKCDKELFFEISESQLDEKWIEDVYKNTEDRSRARFFIRKAIGWALRDMSTKDPESVVKFLNKNKNKLSGLSYREGSRKLSEELKKKLK